MNSYEGLHDLETADMVARVQDAVSMPLASLCHTSWGYSRCDDRLVSVTARDIPMIPLCAHDCVTLFFGSRAAYQDHFDSCPDIYCMTTGWLEWNTSPDGYDQFAFGQQGVMGKLGLTQSREELVAKCREENAEFIIHMMGDWR